MIAAVPRCALLSALLIATAAGQEARDEVLRLVDGAEVRFADEGRRYRVVTAAGHDSGWRTADFEVALRARRFDPLADEGGRGEAGARDDGLRLVQFVTQVLPGYLDELSLRGVEAVRVVPTQTVVVRGAVRRAELEALPFVRWVGPYRAHDRMDPSLLESDAALDAEADFVLQLAAPGLAAKRRVAQFVSSKLGGAASALHAGGYLMQVRVARAQLERLCEHDDVIWVEARGEPRTYLDKVRADTGADVVQGVTGWTGEGVRGEVMDLGIDETHPDFQASPPLLHPDGGWWSIHGTEVTGIVFGTGATDPAARGMLPDGQAIFSPYPSLGDRYAHTAQLLLPPFEAVFQTNSWGYGPIPPGYPSRAFELDDVVFQFDLLTCQSMANQGANVCEGMAYAKNVVSVGGIRHFDTLATGDDAWQMAGSIGPCADGRIKPDLCHWFDSIRTTQAPAGHTSTFGGTSAAAPIVAGCFGLFFQMWHQEWFGNVARGPSVFASRPHAATARAVVINAARSYAFSGTSDDLTRLHQGWGRANVEELLDTGGDVLVVDESRPLQPFDVHAYSVVVAPGQLRLRATLVYTDLPGTSSAGVHRINDLSLSVIDPAGTRYWGNVGLDVGNDSVAGGAADTINPVENVWIDAPAPGVWTVEVYASDISQDAHVETAAVDADYSLVVSGVEPVARDHGQGLAGAIGAPSLQLRGFFVGGDVARFDVGNVPAGALGVLVLGDRDVSAPLFGGVLVPNPAVLATLWFDALGKASSSVAVPEHSASGAVLYAQAWVFDASGPQGFTASSGLRIRVP